MEEVSLHRSSYRALHSETAFFINRQRNAQLLDYKCLQEPHTNTTSSDWHIRAFLQLEAKVKLFFQQHRAERNMEGLIVEQISFYRRLFTIETLCSPDFLSIAFTRLAEHFVLSDRNSIRSAIALIYEEFQDMHLKSVSDAKKITTILSEHFIQCVEERNDSFDYEYAMGLAARMMKTISVHVAKEQESMKMLLNLCSNDYCCQTENVLDVLAVLMPHSRELQDWLLECGSSIPHVRILARHLVIESHDKMEKIWRSLQAEFSNLTNDLDAINVLQSMRLIVQSCVEPINVSFTKVFLEYMQNVIKFDARRRIQNAAIRNVCKFLECQSHIDEKVFQVCKDMTRSLFDSETPFLLSACYLLDKLAKHNNVLRSNDIGAIVQNLEIVVHRNSTCPKVFSVYTRILCNLAIHAFQSHDVARHSINEDNKRSFSFLQSLLQFLQFENFQKSWFHIGMWMNVLDRLQEVCQQFLSIIAPHISAVLLDLLEVVVHEPCVLVQDRVEIKRALIVFISHIACFAKEKTRKSAISTFMVEFRMIEKEASFSNEINRYYLALAVILLRTLDNSIKEDNAILTEMMHLVETYGNSLLQYEITREVMHKGFFGLALGVLPKLADITEHEQLTGFLLMLEKMCSAESSFTVADPTGLLENRTVVGLDTLYEMSQALTYLEGSIDSSQKFVFQRQYISLRLQFLQLVQELQQLIGEVELIARIERDHEFDLLATHFAAVGDGYKTLRLSLLGTSEYDSLVLIAYGRCAYLFSIIVKTLVVPANHSRHSTFPILKSTCYGEYLSNTHLPPLMRFCIVLENAVDGKIRMLDQSITEEDKVAWIVNFVQHFISAFLRRVPCALPRVFFQTQIPKLRVVQGSGQFLTFAEANTFLSKPRARSQLGVSLGSAFTCFFHGALSLGKGYLKEIRQLEYQKMEIDITVHAIDKEHLMHEKVSSRILGFQFENDGTWHSKSDMRQVCGGSKRNGTTPLYRMFVSDVYIEAKHLTVKGSYRISASFVLIDHNGDAWRVPTQDCCRGFIVY